MRWSSSEDSWAMPHPRFRFFMSTPCRVRSPPWSNRRRRISSLNPSQNLNLNKSLRGRAVVNDLWRAPLFQRRSSMNRPRWLKNRVHQMDEMHEMNKKPPRGPSRNQGRWSPLLRR